MGIIVYRQPGCVLSQVWIELLRSHQIPFTERNLAADEAARAELRGAGILGTPVTLVEGKHRIGLDRSTLADLLRLAHQAPRDDA